MNKKLIQLLSRYEGIMMGKIDWTKVSDVTLVIEIGRYEQEALAEAYRRHGGAVFALAKRVLNNRFMAEEITQEVFLRLWDNPSRFVPERGKLRSFLLADVHGRAVDFIRSDVARRDRELKQFKTNSLGGYDLERELIDVSVAEKVREVLLELSPEEKHPIALAYFGGYTYKQVADLLGEPEGTIKSRIRSGLKKLQSKLASEVSENA